MGTEHGMEIFESKNNLGLHAILGFMMPNIEQLWHFSLNAQLSQFLSKLRYFVLICYDSDFFYLFLTFVPFFTCFTFFSFFQYIWISMSRVRMTVGYDRYLKTSWAVFDRLLAKRIAQIFIRVNGANGLTSRWFDQSCKHSKL